MAPLRFGILDDSTPSTLSRSIMIVISLTLVVAICACCRRKKKKDDEVAKGIVELKISPASPPMPPRQPLLDSRLSNSAFSFALNMYRWCGNMNPQKTTLVFPSAIQVAFGHYYDASYGKTKTQLRTAIFPTLSENDANEALKTLATVISPTRNDDEKLWKLACRYYAPEKRLNLFSTKYLQQFDALNNRCGKVMEMIGYSEEDTKKSETVLDEVNLWVQRNVQFMERPLYDSMEKGKKLFFLDKPDPRLVLIVISAFRCLLEHSFRSADTSNAGHVFLCYDGRKTIRNLPMLHSNEEDETNLHYYSEDAECQILRLPIKQLGQPKIDMAIYFILPKERGGLAVMEKTMIAEDSLSKIRNCLQPQYVRIVLPQMRIGIRYLNLSAGIKNVGARFIFDPNFAELGLVVVKEASPAAKDVGYELKRQSDGEDKKSSSSQSQHVGGKSGTTVAKLHETEILCVTDAVHAGAFQLLDDVNEAMSFTPVEPSTTPPNPSIIGSDTSSVTKSGRSIKTASKTASPTGTATLSSTTANVATVSSERPSVTVSTKTSSLKEASVSSKTATVATKGSQSSTAEGSIKAKTPISKDATLSSSMTPSLTKDSSSKSEKAMTKSIFSRLTSSGRTASDKNVSTRSEEKSQSEQDDIPCPVCTRMENRDVIPQLRRFVADHPFMWIVVIEKPDVIPLVIGRFCGK